MNVLILLASTLVLASCGVGSGSVEPVQPVSYQMLELSNPPAFPPGTYIFNSQVELDSAWANAPQTYQGDFFPDSPKPVPTVDFSASSMVGVSLGVGIRCYIPQIVDVTEQGADLFIKYRSGEPDGPTTLACLHLWPLAVFVLLPKTKDAITFTRVYESVPPALPEGAIPSNR